jgi:hypothetical protein
MAGAGHTAPAGALQGIIEAAAKCDADALQHEQPGVPAWVELYAKIGRMRLLSSPRVAALAEQVGQKIIDTYLEPNKTFP